MLVLLEFNMLDYFPVIGYLLSTHYSLFFLKVEFQNNYVLTFYIFVSHSLQTYSTYNNFVIIPCGLQGNN